MTANFNEYLERLKNLNLEIRLALELAESKIGRANCQLAQLNATGLLGAQIVLGDLILQRAYGAHTACSSSGQIVQAALALPGGFGTVLWDSEEFACLRQDSELEREALTRFVVFDDCAPAVKALLVSQIEPLLGELLRRIAAL